MTNASVEETAVLIGVLFKRAGQQRARISEATIRRLSGRSHLRTVFVNRLLAEVDDLGLTMTQLARGGYGMIRSRALEGAPPITAKKFLADELKIAKKGLDMDMEALRAELDE